jgi:hypothetical protein
LVRAIVDHADPNTDAHSHAHTIANAHTITNAHTCTNIYDAELSLSGTDVNRRAKIDAGASSDACADNHRRAGDFPSQT